MALYQHRDLNDFRVKAVPVKAGSPVSGYVPSMPLGGSGGSYYGSDGSITATDGWSANKSAASDLAKVSTAAGLLGVATQNQDLAKLGSYAGLAANLAGAKDATEAAIAAGRFGAGQMGVPSVVSAPVFGAASGYAREGTMEGAAWGAARSAAASLPGGLLALAGAHPLAAAAASMFAGGAMRDVVDNVRLGAEVAPNAPAFSPFSSTVSQHQIGKSIQEDPDPIAALINALSPAVEKDEDETDLGTAKDEAAKAAGPAAAVNVDISISPASSYSYGGWSDSDGNTVGVDANGAVTDSTVVDNFGGVGAVTDAAPASPDFSPDSWESDYSSMSSGGWSGGTAGSGAPGTDSDSNGAGTYGGGRGGVGD